MTHTLVAAVCCELEATEPEGPDGHQHAIDCGGYDPRPRHRCCSARRGDGHRATCRAYTPAATTTDTPDPDTSATP